MTSLKAVILDAIADALNDQLDDGYEVFGDGVDYETVDISIVGEGHEGILIDGLGPDYPAYTIKVEEFK